MATGGSSEEVDPGLGSVETADNGSLETQGQISAERQGAADASS